jgi:hypothetical protein
VFKGMECYWSCAVNNLKIKFCSVQASHIYIPIKRIPKNDLRLGSFGWVLSLFFKGGRGGGFVYWEGAAWPIPRYYHVICLHTKCETGQQKLAEIQQGACPIQVYSITNKSTSLLTDLRNHTSEVCMSLYFPTQNLRYCCQSRCRWF